MKRENLLTSLSTEPSQKPMGHYENTPNIQRFVSAVKNEKFIKNNDIFKIFA